jgi:hypothetical protein
MTLATVAEKEQVSYRTLKALQPTSLNVDVQIRYNYADL